MPTSIRLWDLNSGQIPCRLHGSDQGGNSPSFTRALLLCRGPAAQAQSKLMCLINQHLGISKVWLSEPLLCLEKSRIAWKRGKARQHIEILRKVCHHPLTKISYSPEGFRSSSWEWVGDLSQLLLRLSSVSELMLHVLTYTSTSPQQSFLWVVICQTCWSG